MREGAKGAVPSSNIIQAEAHYMGKGAFVDPTGLSPLSFFDSLATCLQRTNVTGPVGDEKITLEAGLQQLSDLFKRSHAGGGKAIFIGNGGSAAIASHMAVDYCKNKGVRSVALNDAAMLTMLANDMGYEQVFAQQIRWHGRKPDVAVIISSSGRSLNIVAAADAAREVGMRGIVTLSGMNPHNKLRRKGCLNFYVPCVDYGLVELSHMALLHSVASAG